jgi:hypothetical protein
MSVNKIKYAIIHCSASPFGNAALITKWHLERGWETIGYHLIILNGHISNDIYNFAYNGEVETGRPFDNNSLLDKTEQGAHVLGLNDESLGICLIGNPIRKINFTDYQLDALAYQLYRLKENIPDIEIKGHYQIDERKPNCPGIDVEKFKKQRHL